MYRYRCNLFLSLTALPILAAPGCGPSAPYDIAPVRGRVAYEDGTPIPGARVSIAFESEAPAVDAKRQPRTGHAEVNPDGTFDSVTTWKAGDGAIVGPHKIVIRSRDQKEIPTQHVPKIYTSPSTTPLTADIQPGGDPLEFKIAKP